MTDLITVPIPGILGFRSNRGSISQYPLVTGTSETLVCEDKLKALPINVTYTVGNLNDAPSSPGGKFFHRISDDIIYYESSFGMFAKIKLKLIWDDHNPQLIVNSEYHYLGRASVETVHSTGRHLRDITNIALLNQGYVLLHGAAFTLNDKTALLIGLSNTGKTSTVVDFVQSFGAKYFGDDLVVTDGRHIFACPTTRMNIDPQKAKSSTYRAYQHIIRSIPFAENFLPTPNFSLQNFLGDSLRAEPKPVTDIFILTASPANEEIAITEEQASRLVYASNQAEFTHNTSQVLWAAEYFGTKVPTYDAMMREKSIIEDLVGQCNVHHLAGTVGFFRKQLCELMGVN